nr:MAG TPA: hypothetical protein [Caudoviricetes sp.]
MTTENFAKGTYKYLSCFNYCENDTCRSVALRRYHFFVRKRIATPVFALARNDTSPSRLHRATSP